MRNINCIICGSSQRNFKYKYEIGNNVFFLVRCKNCGLFYTFPQPIPEQIVELYPEHYYSYLPYRARKFLSKGKGLSLISKVKISIKRQILNKCYHYFPGQENRTFLLPRILLNIIKYCFVIFPPFVPNGRILDVGCGSGEYLFVINQLGWDTYGLEINEKAAAYARSKGLNVITGETLDAAQLPSEYFDVVRFNHVLEHFPDPVGALRESYRILKSGGFLLITVPNVNSIEMDLFGKYCWQLVIPEHLFHFSSDSLKKLLDKAGFRVERIEYLPYIEIIGNLKRLIIRNPGKKSFFVQHKSAAAVKNLLMLPLGYFFAVLKKSNTISILARK